MDDKKYKIGDVSRLLGIPAQPVPASMQWGIFKSRFVFWFLREIKNGIVK